MSVPTVKLNTGASMPAVGLGTWQGGFGDESNQAKDAILGAVQQGYRYIDTAWFYNSERAVGQAIKDSGIPRSEFFVVTKLWNTYHRRVQEGLEKSLELLGPGVEGYVDLYLMHWPVAWKYAGDDRKPVPGSGEIPLDDERSFVQTWQDMEKLDKRQVKAIGVSNFSIKTLDILLPEANIVPAVNQVEMSPWLQQDALKKYCNGLGIVMTGYSPFGQGKADILEDSTLIEIGKSHNVNANTIAISWIVQRGDTVCPKSGDQKRQKENITLVKLSDDEMRRIAAIDKGKRIVEGKDPTMGWSLERLGWSSPEK